MQPKIAIGCPVRNRAWVLPEYLGALLKIDVPNPENLRFIFLDNDSFDDTSDLLYYFYQTLMDRSDGERPHGTCKIETLYTDCEMWQRGDYAHNQYANLANVRNQFLEMFLRTDADYLLSVDSDVIVPPDIVTRLLDSMNLWSGDKEVIVGAAISNVPNKPLDGKTPGNFMIAMSKRIDIGPIVYPTAYHHPVLYNLTGISEVDLIGAVYLIPRSVIEAGARYAPHPQGEDAPFCQAAQRLGYRLLVDMDVKCEHRMVKPE